jgi:hypothetical protein
MGVSGALRPFLVLDLMQRDVADINTSILRLKSPSQRVGKEYALTIHGSGGGLIDPGNDSEPGSQARNKLLSTLLGRKTLS